LPTFGREIYGFRVKAKKKSLSQLIVKFHQIDFFMGIIIG